MEGGGAWGGKRDPGGRRGGGGGGGGEEKAIESEGRGVGRAGVRSYDHIVFRGEFIYVETLMVFFDEDRKREYWRNTRPARYRWARGIMLMK